MAIIDSLLMEVGIDSSAFQKNSKQVDKSTKELQESAESLSDAYKDADKSASDFSKELKKLAKEEEKLKKKTDQTKKTVVKFLAAFLVKKGIVKMIDHVTALNTQLYYTSKNLGVSARSLKSWQNTAELMGGSAQSITSTMEMLSKSQTEMQVTGQTGILPYMRALGVSMFDADGKAKSLDDMLIDLADRFGKMDRVQASNFGSMMGIDQDTLNMLLEGRDAVQSTLAAQKEMRKATEAETAASKKLTQARTKLNQQFEAVAVVLVTAITPALVEITEGAATFFEFLAKHEGMAKALFIGLAAVITTVLLPAIWAGVVAIWTLMAPFLLFAAIVAAVAVAVGLLWDDFNKWSEGGESALGSFFDLFAKGWKDAGKTFKGVVNSIKKYWDDLTDFFKKAWRFFIALLSGDKTEITKAGKELAEAWANAFLSKFEIIRKAYDLLMDTIKGGKAVKDDIQKNGGKGVWSFTKDKILKPIGDFFSPPAQAATSPQPVPVPVPNRVNVASKVPKYNKVLALTQQDIEDIIKVTSTEVVPSLKGEGFTGQVHGVVDTILNRAQSGKWGAKGDIRSVVNANRQFSKIAGPESLNPYGSVQNMPYSHVNKKIEAEVLQYIKDRATGMSSSVGDHLNYANPYYSDAYNKRTWVDDFYNQSKKEGLIRGYGKAIHAHGTTKDLNKYRPGEFGVSMPNSWANRASSIASTGDTNTTVTNNIQKIEVYTTANTITGVANDSLVATRNRVNQIGSGMM